MPLVDGFLGGSLIGVSAAILLLFSGEVMGASGIINEAALTPLSAWKTPAKHWKWAFLCSFMLVSMNLTSHYLSMDNLQSLFQERTALAYVVGGLFTGFGTKMGNGCTSGHGICGLGRFSFRSFSAVMTFMACTVATTYATKDDPVWQSPSPMNDTTIQFASHAATAVVGLLSMAALSAPLLNTKQEGDSSTTFGKTVIGAIVAAIFAYGLYLSGMILPQNVIGFLDVAQIANGTWDPSLMAVMGGGVLVSFLSYQLVEGFSVLPEEPKRRISLEKPIALRRGSKFENIPTNQETDNALLVGGACFGVGWALAGMCPAPALFMAAAGIPQAIFQWFPAYLLGAAAASVIKGA